MIDSATDNELVQQVLDGRDASYGSLVRRYEKYIYRFICKMVGDEQERLDLTQDTFLRARKKLSGFRPNDGSFKIWLILKAKSVVSNHYRGKKRYQEAIDRFRGVVEPGDVWGKNNRIVEADVVRKLCVAKVMAGVSLENRELAFFLSEFINKKITQKEIAQIRSCSEKTVSRNFKKLIKKLRPLLESCR